MTGYQRFAAYVYEYRKGKKGQNCGFIKVEVKEGRCVLEIHLRCQGILPDTTCKVYGFVRRDGLLMGLPLGSLSTKEDGLEGCIETEAANMGGSDISIGKIGGMIILTDSGGFYGTEWDDQIIRPANFQEMRPMEKTKEEGEKKKEKVIGQRTEEKREEKDMGDPQEVMERTEEENGEGQGGQEEMREPGSLEASGEGLGQYEKAQKEEEPEDVMQGEEAQGEKPGMPEGKVQKEEVQKEEEQKEEVQEVGISTEKAGEEVLKEEEPREGEAGAREEAQKEEGEMAMEAQDMEERRPPQPSEPEDRLSSPESLPPGPEDRPLSPGNRPSPESLPPGPE
ncbi:MAG: hypothetical protein Q4D55_04025, partial [Eubacteriales bacterium]|nr:hypothetical protein [Eubacteriales bacterium]